MKKEDGRRMNITDARGRVDTSTPERFVGIDIADASDDRLIEKRSFHGSVFAALQAIVEHVWREISGKRLGAELSHEVDIIDRHRRDEPHPAKFA